MTRAARNRAIGILAGGAFAVSAAILVFLIAVIVLNGMAGISLEFLTTPSSDFGASGGILYQLIGSVLMVGVAAMIAMPISVGVAIFLSEYVRARGGTVFGLTLLFGLNGVPSIVFGIFGLVFFVYFLGTGISWLVGSVILAMMMLPAITLSAFQSIDSIPATYRESAYALGLRRTRVVTEVLVPQGFHGAVTGLLIAVARAVGETAPIMFIATAFSGVALPRGPGEPVSTLPTHILALAQQATNPQAMQNAWGASFLLFALVVVFSFSALMSRLQLRGFSVR